MAKDATEKKIEVQVPVHDPVPTLFADGLHSASSIANVVRVDLFVERAWPGADKPQPMIVGRLVIPTARVASFAKAINELADKIKTTAK